VSLNRRSTPGGLGGRLCAGSRSYASRRDPATV
jgi:hypothetical protein